MAETGMRDFDFFHGKWRVQHRRLKDRLVGSDEWQLFDGRCICQPTLGGAGNFDDNILELPEGHYRAMTIRSFDQALGRWSIWWLDGRTPGQLDVPVVGQFAGDLGSFVACDVFNGRNVRVRFQWRKGVQPKWEQAMSADDGRSWEVNWTMVFRRDNAVAL